MTEKNYIWEKQKDNLSHLVSRPLSQPGVGWGVGAGAPMPLQSEDAGLYHSHCMWVWGRGGILVTHTLYFSQNRTLLYLDFTQQSWRGFIESPKLLKQAPRPRKVHLGRASKATAWLAMQSPDFPPTPPLPAKVVTCRLLCICSFTSQVEGQIRPAVGGL